MASAPVDERKAISRRLNAVPRVGKYAALEAHYGASNVRRLRGLLTGARQRCENPNNMAYPSYGGRGITFGFASIYDAVVYCLTELGPIPVGKSIDRIDNEAGYEPGNIRWATPAEQARNKRQYKRTRIGRAIRRVMQHRDDLTYETVRLWLHSGITEQQAMTRGKYARSGL